MKKTTALLLSLILILLLCACGAKDEPAPVPTPAPTAAATEAPAPTETPKPVETPAPTEAPVVTIPPVWDESLNEVLSGVASDVRPGSSGASLRAIQCAAKLLDWGSTTALSDDEIYSAACCYMDTLDTDTLLIYMESILNVYDGVYSLRDGNAEELMDTAGVSDSLYPWNDRAFRSVEMISYAAGER